jgi:hypothetical protein
MPTQVRDFKGERVPHPSFLRVGPFCLFYSSEFSRRGCPTLLPCLP